MNAQNTINHLAYLRTTFVKIVFLF